MNKSPAFQFPTDIQGWLTETEGQVLFALAANREVLELGCWKGRSTVCMAQGAKHVTCVDHFKGDENIDLHLPAPISPTTVWEEFWNNLKSRNLHDKVTIFHGDMGAAVLSDAAFDLVFVDGAHDLESVRRDLAIAARCVKPGGVIALHDWNATSVKQAAAEVLGWDSPDPGEITITSEYGFYARAYKPAPRPKVFVGIPHRNGVSGAAAMNLIDSRNYRTYSIEAFRAHSTSLLTLCFNSLWCQALNERKKLGLTHFAMHHDDIVPEEGWLNKLLEEQRRSGADIISCVVPIKDDRGLSSTAIMDPKTRTMRRLTIKECLKLPRTFTPADIDPAFAGYHLLLNTGLWVCDFTKPWVEDAVFTIRDKIVKRRLDNGDIEFSPMCFSEDWVFSKWACERGLKLAATNAVKLRHQGMMDYWNDRPWGEWDTDQGHGETFEPPEQAEDFPIPHVEPG